MTKTGLEFGILVIVICLIFDICDLEFLFLQYSLESAFNGKNDWEKYVGASRQVNCTVSLFHPQRIRAEVSHPLPLLAIVVLPQEAQFHLLLLLEYLPYRTRE